MQEVIATKSLRYSSVSITVTTKIQENQRPNTMITIESSPNGAIQPARLHTVVRSPRLRG